MKKGHVDLASQVGVTADRKLNDELYPKVVAGDKDAIEQMIKANMALVTYKVQSYLLMLPSKEYLRDDLQAQGFLAVVEAVNKLVGSDTPDPNPTGFISQEIHFALGELIDIEATVRVPNRTFRENKARGTIIQKPEREGTIDFNDVRAREAKQDPRSMLMLRDELMACCENGTDRHIIHLREQGFSDADIAKTLGIPKTSAYMMRRSIYARFLARNPEYKGEA